jgi:hypothetical protein
MGSLELELLEPDHHPSTWRESLDKNGEGPHHIAFVVEGMNEKIAMLQPDAGAPKRRIYGWPLRLHRHAKRFESNHRTAREGKVIRKIRACMDRNRVFVRKLCDMSRTAAAGKSGTRN